MPAITSANVAQAIVKLVAAEALPALVSNLVMGNLVNRDYEPTLAQAGDTVNVPIPGTMVANNLAEGASIQKQNPSIGNAQIVLTNHVEASFSIPDVTKALATPDLVSLYAKPAINAVAERIEGDLLSLYAGFTSNPVLGTAGTPLTEAVLGSVETAFFDAKVPANEPKVLVVSSTDYDALRSISRFSEAQTVGSGAAITTGNLGKLKDLYILRSQLVQKTGVGTVTTHNIAFAKNGLALVMRRLPAPPPGMGVVSEYMEMGGYGFRITMSYDKDTLATQFTVDVLYGCGVLDIRYGMQVNS